MFTRLTIMYYLNVGVSLMSNQVRMCYPLEQFTNGLIIFAYITLLSAESNPNEMASQNARARLSTLYP